MFDKRSPAVHIKTLDVLRGLAASMVVFVHVIQTVIGYDYVQANPPSPSWLERNVFQGALAVTLFFVVSGTSLSLSAFSKPNGFNIRSFFIRRFFRIYPLYVLILVICLFIRPIYATYVGWGMAAPNSLLGEQLTQPLTPVVWLTHLTLTFNLFHITPTFEGPVWTLPVEFQFYLLFPIMVYLLQTGRKRGVLLLGAFLFVIHVLSFLNDASLMALLRAWEFGGGVLLGLYWRQVAAFMRRTHMRLAAVIAAAVMFEVARYLPMIPIIPDNLLDVCFCFVVVALALSYADWQPQRRAEVALLNIGNWSYSLYLIHVPVIAVLTPLLHLLISSQIVYLAVTFPLVYGVSTVLARILYTRFEQPFIRMGARYSKARPAEIVSVASTQT